MPPDTLPLTPRVLTVRKVIVLGLDGFPFTLLQQFLGRGVTPAMQALLRRGSLAQMDSVYPTVSSVAWCSVVTGKNPGKFGVFGFTEVDPQFRIRVPSSRDVRARTMWEIASAAGKRVIGLGVPLTHPPRPVNGVLVSGFLAPRLEGAVHPPGALSRLQKNGYRIDVNVLQARQSVDFLRKDLVEVLAARRRTLLDFLDNDPWDLLVCHVMETDRVNHFMWRHLEEPESEHGRFVIDFYRQVDSLVGEVAERLDGATTLIVMSDHGFCRCRHDVQVNAWLEAEGYLKIGPDRKKGFEAIAPGSRAFAQVPGRIHLLRTDRWQNGSVAEAEYEPLRDELIAKLKDWCDPQTGTPICRKVMRKEEAFHGPYLATAPDIIIDPEDGYDLKAGVEGGKFFTHGPISGMHTYRDAFAYVSDHKLREARPVLYNMGSTILDLLGIEVPADWDGRSILAA